MEVNIIILIERFHDYDMNEKMIRGAFREFVSEFPDSIIENPVISLVGKNSQKIKFAIAAPDVDQAKDIQSYFDQCLFNQGFRVSEEVEDAEEMADDFLRSLGSVSGNTVVSKEQKTPWWKFW